MPLNPVVFSSAKDSWGTPGWLFDVLDAEFHFTLDAAASDENALCTNYYTEKTDGLQSLWPLDAVVYINCPYGRNITGKWVEKSSRQSQLGNTVVMLLPARTDTKWFHDYIYEKPGVHYRFIRGRLKFVGAKSGAPFPSMVVVFEGKLGDAKARLWNTCLHTGRNGRQ